MQSRRGGVVSGCPVSPGTTAWLTTHRQTTELWCAANPVETKAEPPPRLQEWQRDKTYDAKKRRKNRQAKELFAVWAMRHFGLFFFPPSLSDFTQCGRSDRDLGHLQAFTSGSHLGPNPASGFKGLSQNNVSAEHPAWKLPRTGHHRCGAVNFFDVRMQTDLGQGQ